MDSQSVPLPEGPNGSLARGLRTLAAMADVDGAFSVSVLAGKLGFTRAMVRRFVVTLEHAGYVEAAGGMYRLTPEVLELGEAYLSSSVLDAASRAPLAWLSSQVDESTSLGVLHRGMVTLVASVEAGQLPSDHGVFIGARLPAHRSANGLVLLAGLDEESLADYCASLQDLAGTQGVADAVAATRKRGWASWGRQPPDGAAIAVPVRGQDRVVAAACLYSGSAYESLDELRNRALDPLFEAAARIESGLAAPARGRGGAHR
uniref:IclR family transcriptional regulator n=1 Tax=Arthrobacter sp. TaxID=1667 RepID=UPI000EB71FF2|nr:IclR family transcriptional regulator C-terminal domain-containing protein [Arthrobacter sp.]AXV46637.1 IclR family transcriptional regulator [Arthrobacter sp.]